MAFRVMAFRVMAFRVMAFRVMAFRVVAFRVLGFPAPVFHGRPAFRGPVFHQLFQALLATLNGCPNRGHHGPRRGPSPRSFR
jgi:hypothetical protein